MRDRLTLLADRAVARAFASALGTKRLARTIEYHQVITTTMERGAELVRGGTPDGTLLVADHQTAGRGRRGRSWGYGPPGSLLILTWLIRMEGSAAPLFMEGSAAPLFNVLVAVALVRALRAVGVERLAVKWPNDVLLDGKKLAGVLAVSAMDSAGAHWVILGTGVDVHTRGEDYPPEVRHDLTSLATSGYEVDRLALLARLAPELERLVDAVDGERGAYVAEWRGLSATLGRRVRVDDGATSYDAEAVDLDPDGALVVRRGGRLERILAADVSVRSV